MGVLGIIFIIFCEVGCVVLFYKWGIEGLREEVICSVI